MQSRSVPIQTLRWRSAWAGEKGAALMLIVLCLVSLLGFAALALDVGQCQVQKNAIQEGADAAVLGAVQQWAVGATAGAVVNLGTAIAGQNSVLTGEIVSLTPGVWNAATKTFTPNLSIFGNNAVPAVRAVVNRRVPTAFARVFGFSTITVKAQSTAIAAQAMAATGLVPWFTCAQGGATPQPCDSITLKYSAINKNGICTGTGNFGALSFPGQTGGEDYRTDIQYGYQGLVRIGDVLNTLTGDKVGPTSQGMTDRLAGAPAYSCNPANPVIPSQRLAVVVVTDPLDYNGSTVVVRGFWVMALDNSSGGQVTARYVKIFTGQEIDPHTPPAAVGVSAVALAQ